MDVLETVRCNPKSSLTLNVEKPIPEKPIQQSVGPEFRSLQKQGLDRERQQAEFT